MAESELHIKNEIAFARRIAEAKELCMRYHSEGKTESIDSKS